MPISENIRRLQERISGAAQRAGRDPAQITLMAVTKTVQPERIREAHRAGIRIFGENRVQEFAAKVDSLRDFPAAEWRMIGHLQSNKANKAVELFAAVDSVDSLKLANRLNAAAMQLGRTVPVLIEINVGGEAAKSGLAPESEAFEEILRAAPRLESLQIRGLMTIPPYHDDAERSRPYFRRMRELFAAVAGRSLPSMQMSVLSMGMSHDFEVAIEEGSTCVRIGTAIFGDRPK